MLHALRRRQLRIARAALGVFAATWLGLALQPCHAALAGAAPEPPAAAQAAMPCHGGDAAESVPAGADHEPCPYCGDEGTAACKLGTGVGCGAASAPVLELRDLALQWPALLPAALPSLDWAPTRRLLPPSAGPADPPPKVPAQERFCTHLE